MKAKVYILILVFLPIISYGQWITQATGFTDSLRGLEHIWAVDDNVVWAIAFDGSGNDSIIQEFTRTTNGGAQWTPGTINGASGYTPTMIFALNADTAWVMLYDPVNDGGKIFRTNDAGLTWTHQSTALFVDSLEAYPNLIYFWTKNEGFCMGDPTSGYFEIYSTTNGGALWSRVDSLNMPSLISGEYGYAGIFSVVGNTVWFGTNKGRIFKSDNKGNSWASISTPFTNNGKIRIIQFKDTLNGIIGNRSNNSFNLYTTSDGGSNWNSVTPAGTVYGNNIVYVPGTPGTLISTGNKTGYSGSGISYDFGNTWTDIPGSTGTPYTALSFFNNQTGWAGLKNQSSTVGGIAKFKIYSYDAGISTLEEPVSPCEGIETVKVKLANYGYGVIDTVTINWEVNAINQTPVIYSTALGAGQSVDVTLGSYNFVYGVNVNLIAYTSNPNGAVDTFPANDTLSVILPVNPLPVVFLGNDTTIIIPFLLLDAGGGFVNYLWSTGDSTQTIIIDTTDISNGTTVAFSVIVTDTNGCIGYDTIVVSCITVSIFENEISETIQISPNPSNGKFLLKISDNITITKLYIYDCNGRIVYYEDINVKNCSVINLSDYPNGIYYLKAVSKDNLFFRKLILSKL